jgi:type I restriction enzyme, R subunit
MIGCAGATIVEGRRFSDLLDEAIRRHKDRRLSAAEIIAELPRHRRDAQGRGVALCLRDYALACNEAVRESATIDLEETVRVAMRAHIRRRLNRSGDPRDRRERAGQLVIERAELPLTLPAGATAGGVD